MLIALVATMACGGSMQSYDGAEPVQVWLTTADQSKLLSHETYVGRMTASATSLPVIDVDPSVRYQRMVGFGAAFTDASVHLLRRMPPAKAESLMQELFGRSGGIGLSFARIPMGASDFSLGHYTYDDVPEGRTDNALARFTIDADRADKIPVIARALAINPALTLVASPWSAPAWMKTSGSLIGGTLKPEWYGGFADYFVKFIEAYRDAGIPITAVTIQNEPAHEPKDYPGMLLAPRARATIVGQHLGPALARARLSTQIWEWDHNWDAPGEPLAVLADPVARPFIQAVAWHCYAGNVAAQDTVRAAHPDKDVYFTECAGGEWATVFGDNLKFNVSNLVIGSTRGWARGVALWNLALDERGGPHLGGCGNCRGVVTINASTGDVTRNVEYYALAHASKFVRVGAHRIASASPIDGLETVAFLNADDASRVVIVLNGAAQPRTFSVRSEERAFTHALPAGAVATFVWR